MSFKALFFAVYHRARIIMILLPILTVLIPLPAVHADPSAFSLISPEDGASVSTDVLLDWEDSADPIHPDGLTYTIILSKGDDSFEGPISIIEIANSCYLLKKSEDTVEEIDSLADNSTYYWKVQAINGFGGFFETESRYFRTNNAENPVAAWIGGHVYNNFQNPISDIIIRVLILSGTFSDFETDFRTDSDGNFCSELESDKPQNGYEEEIKMKISAEGCTPKEITATIVHGESADIGDITLECDPVVAEIKGYVYNSLQEPIANADVEILNLWNKDFSFKTDASGYFSAELEPDTPMESDMKEDIAIEISAEGYVPKSISTKIVLGDLTEIGDIILKCNATGDINGDCRIDLKDAVLALQILAGEQPSEDIYKETALTEDQKIGLPELVYILREIASYSPSSG